MTFVRLLVLDSDVVGWGECRSVEERIVVYIIIIMIARGARVRLQQCEYIIICARTARVKCEWCNVLTTRGVREDRKRKKKLLLFIYLRISNGKYARTIYTLRYSRKNGRSRKCTAAGWWYNANLRFANNRMWCTLS